MTIIINERSFVTWEFKATEKELDVSSSVSNAMLTGIAASPKERIPARAAESEKNATISLLKNASQSTLSGISQTVPGAIYSLFFYVPKDVFIANVQADAENLSHRINPNGLFEVSFKGQQPPVNWNVNFKK